MLYREKFIFQPLFKNENLKNKKLIELACGSGFNSVYLKNKFHNLQTTGVDISKDACKSYTKSTGEYACVMDITKAFKKNKSYDAAVVIGGLHHCISDLPTTFKNIHSLIKPNGTLYMMEPNRDFFLNNLRTQWYKLDKYFDSETEQALSHDAILFSCKNSFELIDVRYFGGPAYFIIFNSLILRIPQSLKPFLSPALFLLEHIFAKLSSKKLSPCFLARWRRI
jgi:SAM-dependent methyltransferase